MAVILRKSTQGLSRILAGEYPLFAVALHHGFDFGHRIIGVKILNHDTPFVDDGAQSCRTASIWGAC